MCSDKTGIPMVKGVRGGGCNIWTFFGKGPRPPAAGQLATTRTTEKGKRIEIGPRSEFYPARLRAV
jgi:hypothetical protein